MNTPASRFTLLMTEDWTPQQALAVYELLSEMAETVWSRYEIELIDLLASELDQDPASQPELFDFDDQPPF
jgi:hypothetical protein